jgi:hypothetical protein
MAKDYLGADNNKVLPRFRHAIDEEASELSDFARALRARIQAWPGVFDRPINDLNTILQAARSRAEAEACTRSLRTPIAATLVGCGEFCRQSKLSLPDRRAAYDDRNWAADELWR